MADKKISELDAITGAATAADDFFIVVDSSGSATKKISREELNNAIERDVLSTVDIDGGTIDGTTIGGSSAAAGTFTDLTVTGTVTGISTGISNVVEDTTPQLGGNLDLNGSNITGTGNISTTGTATFTGDLTVDTNTLYVDSTNNRVGIGTSSPFQFSSVQASLTLSGISGSFATRAGALTFQSQDTTSTLCHIHARDGYMAFETGTSATSSEALRIDSSGFVGISTSSPQNELDVRGTVEIGNGSTQRMYLQGTGTDFRFYDRANLAERLRIGSTGIIYVNGDGTGGRIYGDGSGGLVLQDGNGRQSFVIDSPASGSSQAMTLDASGNLLVGKTSSAFGTAGGEIKSNGQITATATNAAAMQINRKSSDGTILNFAKDNSTVGGIGSRGAGTSYIILKSTGGAGAGLTGSDNAILPMDESALADANTSLGTGSYRFKDLYLSGAATAGGLSVDGGTIKLDGNYPTGTGNVALGDTALASGSLSGADNTAIGDQALYSNTTGAQVTGVGALSLANNTTGFGNSGLGYASLVSNTTGNYNTALGRSAFNSNTTASNNTAVGYGAGYSNTTGYSNTALGTSALYANTTGANIVAVGHAALDANTTGNNNTGVGKNALGANTTGEHNSGVGLSALESNTTGINNTAIGRSAGASVTGSSYNTFVGHYAGQSTAPSGTGGENTFIGQGSGYLVTTGTQNTILGRYNGNQGNLDIRTTSNNIVLADGDGNVSLRVNGGNNPASKFYSPVSTPLYGVGNARVNIMSRSGNLIQFLDGSSVVQGSITISGTTVSYNGGHLARWSRLLDNSKDTSIVKGTVMTNLDEMVEWGDEDNEQLNKMAVSSVEGDPNVAGVFVNWDTSEENSDDNIPDWNDMNVAMTGDMVIRIAQGTTVARGDLLMSAGDGTAKPQGDDIVRSKTIAKVTSTNVSHTYDDGSYLVPCVLMAC